jgi:hypothetical protein
LRVPQAAARIYNQGYASKVILSGNRGRWGNQDWDKTEAEVFKDIMVKMGVPEKAFLPLDKEATNTGANIVNIISILKNENITPKSVVLFQTPISQRRSWANFVQDFTRESTYFGRVECINYSPYIPDVSAMNSDEFCKFVTFVWGEIERLIEYSYNGWINKEIARVPEDIIIGTAALFIDERINELKRKSISSSPVGGLSGIYMRYVGTFTTLQKIKHVEQVKVNDLYNIGFYERLIGKYVCKIMEARKNAIPGLVSALRGNDYMLQRIAASIIRLLDKGGHGLKLFLSGLKHNSAFIRWESLRGLRVIISNPEKICDAGEFLPVETFKNDIIIHLDMIVASDKDARVKTEARAIFKTLKDYKSKQSASSPLGSLLAGFTTSRLASTDRALALTEAAHIRLATRAPPGATSSPVSPTITGEAVILTGAILEGNIAIDNRTSKVIDLNNIPEDIALIVDNDDQFYKNQDGRLYLKDMKITISSSPVEKITKDNNPLGVVIRKNHQPQGFEVFTDMAEPFAVSCFERKKGTRGDLHYHTAVEGPNSFGSKPRQEFVHVLEGKIKVFIYTVEGEYINSVILQAGDSIYLTEAHQVEFLEDTKLLEVKQGPYPDSRDKDMVILSSVVINLPERKWEDTTDSYGSFNYSYDHLPEGLSDEINVKFYGRVKLYEWDEPGNSYDDGDKHTSVTIKKTKLTIPIDIIDRVNAVIRKYYPNLSLSSSPVNPSLIEALKDKYTPLMVGRNLNQLIAERAQAMFELDRKLKVTSDKAVNEELASHVDALNARRVLDILDDLSVAPTEPFIEELQNDEKAIKSLLKGELVTQMPIAGEGNRMHDSLVSLGINIPRDRLKLANIDVWEIAQAMGLIVGTPSYALRIGFGARQILALQQGILD